MGDKGGLDLSAPQIAGSALAAATAAVGASFLGVTGTVIGAALASAATTIGNAVYTHYIHRTKDRFMEAHGLIAGEQEAAEERADESAVPRPGEEGLATAVHATVRGHGPADLPPGDATSPVSVAQVPPLRREGTRGPLWVTLIVAAAATFALAMGGILAFELVSGKPLSATVHGRDGSGTSLGGSDSGDEGPSPIPSTSPGSGTTDPAAKPSPTPSTAKTGREPSPSAEPSSPPSQSPESTGDSGVKPTTDSGTGGTPHEPGQPDSTSE
jgi:hypothetical protein